MILLKSTCFKNLPLTHLGFNRSLTELQSHTGGLSQLLHDAGNTKLFSPFKHTTIKQAAPCSSWSVTLFTLSGQLKYKISQNSTNKQKINHQTSLSETMFLFHVLAPLIIIRYTLCTTAVLKLAANNPSCMVLFWSQWIYCSLEKH